MLRLITEAEKIKPIAAESEIDVVDTNQQKVDEVEDTQNIEHNTSETDVESHEDPVENSIEISPDVIIKACKDSVNNLIQTGWEFISNINSVITTLDYDYQKENKNDLLDILNTAVDDVTVVIGMLHSGVNLLDPKVSELLQDGAEKAENLIEVE